MTGSPPPTRRLTRKEFFRETWRGLATFLYELFGDSLDAVEQVFPEVIRPPGALPEAEFLQRCTRCGACRAACPHFVIRPVTRPGSFEEGTPQIVPTEAWCRLCPDFPCLAACPTGALRRDPDHPPRIGLAVVDPRACLRPAGTSCAACQTACPTRFRAISFADPDAAPSVAEDRCTGCGACAAACPALPARAIRIHPRG
ncbi:MAG: 4Fe-4S dicluster domain-containing protein [Candidatus Riflebacteria bacterium]|nr:4Fe-4S dicluster domain-containing protein [Candidatus Riflebacteria bacterium]